jgi:hypothetical protein
MCSCLPNSTTGSRWPLSRSLFIGALYSVVTSRYDDTSTL